jgi:hypothetical protein
MRALPLVVAGAFLSTCAAFAAEPMTPSDIQATFSDGKPFTAATTSGTQFKMIFTADGKMTRQPHGKSGKRSSGTWKLDTSGFCTSWKGAESNCYTVVPSGKNKWSIQKGFHRCCSVVKISFQITVFAGRLPCTVPSTWSGRIRLVWAAPSLSAEQHCPLEMQGIRLPDGMT